MSTLSVCLIVKNNHETLDKCLSSINKIADELIIVDTGSTDDTKEIAKKYNAKIFDFVWTNDFSEARNYSFEKATCDYIMWLDSDDYITEYFQNKIIELKNDLNKYDTVNMLYNYAFDIDGNVTLQLGRERIIKRSLNCKWIGYIHEYIDASKAVIHHNTNIEINHGRVHNESDRNLNIYKYHISQGKELNARDTYYFGKELYYHNIYDEALTWLEKTLNMNSWYEDKIGACIAMGDIYLALNQNENCRNICYKSFEYYEPRAEILYNIALSFQNENKLSNAVYWYKLAANCKIPNTMGTIRKEYYDFKPYLQLCVLYYKLGDIEKSKHYNKLAGEISPNHPSIIYNNKFFGGL